jgi:hypothetical protein
MSGRWFATRPLHLCGCRRRRLMRARGRHSCYCHSRSTRRRGSSQPMRKRRRNRCRDGMRRSAVKMRAISVMSAHRLGLLARHGASHRIASHEVSRRTRVCLSLSDGIRREDSGQYSNDKCEDIVWWPSRECGSYSKFFCSFVDLCVFLAIPGPATPITSWCSSSTSTRGRRRRSLARATSVRIGTSYRRSIASPVRSTRRRMHSSTLRAH